MVSVQFLILTLNLCFIAFDCILLGLKQQKRSDFSSQPPKLVNKTSIEPFVFSMQILEVSMDYFHTCLSVGLTGSTTHSFSHRF